MKTKIALFVLYFVGILAAYEWLDYFLSSENMLKSDNILNQLMANPIIFSITLIAYAALVIYLQFFKYPKDIDGYKPF